MRKRQKIIVDASIDIPEGVEDLVYDTTYIDPDAYDELITEGEADGDTGTTGPPVPTTFTIVKQTLREGPDGKLVVDVVIETDDHAGYEIDFRISKA